MNASSPAQIAKGALRRLAMAQLEPTPENFARMYAEESGQPQAVLPERARALIDRLAARSGDDAARREELVTALMQGRWDQAAQALERGTQSASAQAQALAGQIERLVRGLERPGRNWTLARKKESLQRVLDGSRSDVQRLSQRLQSLLGAWDGDQPLPEDGAAATEAAPEAAPLAAPVPAPGETGASPVAGPRTEAGDWTPVVDCLHDTVAAALPGSEARAAELADRLGAIAARLADAGPTADNLESLLATCGEARRLFAHRHHLVEQLGALCHELGQGMVELAEDESWARGQAETLQARLADGVNARSVRAASEILAETRVRQQQVRAERDAAREALKQLINRLLLELDGLDEHTGRFHDSMGRHADAIARADTLESLAGVVREMVDESRAVQSLVRQAQERLHGEHTRAGELQQRVRELETELRRLSEEVSTDALTQVANRRGLAQVFDVECARIARAGGGSPLGVALLDIDNFKKLNDTLGHAAGDEALKALAATVRERLRPGDHLARFGGEEFVVLLPDTALDEAQQALSRLQRGLTAALFMHDDKEVFVTFSAGVTAWRSGERLESALERADEALYEAKRTGKNRTCVA